MGIPSHFADLENFSLTRCHAAKRQQFGIRGAHSRPREKHNKKAAWTRSFRPVRAASLPISIL